MSEQRIRVGIVGLQPGRSWAAIAHLPALRHLSNDFEVAGVANSSLASAEAAVVACGIPRAYSDVAALVAAPDIDLIAVTVKVPAHYGIVEAALNAGKQVYCEWPVGRALEETEALANLARRRGVLAVAGTQARVSPAMRELGRLVAEGYVGEVLSSRITGWGRKWGATIDDLKTDGYLLRHENGANMLTIPFAHTLAGLRDVLGDIGSLSVVLDTRHRRVLATETGEHVPMDTPDQILIAGQMASGATLSMHYQGGIPRESDGFAWDIHGSDGDLRVTGPSGHTQIVPLTISGARGEDRLLQTLPLPADDLGMDELVPGNVARIYRRIANDLRHGTTCSPTFDDALALHKSIAAIERSAREGVAVEVNAPNRVLPDLV